MDRVGFHERRRAEREARQYASWQQGPVEQEPDPMNERWRASLDAAKQREDPDVPEVSRLNADAQEEVGVPDGSKGTTGYQEPNYRPPGWVPPGHIPGAMELLSEAQGTHTGPGASIQEAQDRLDKMHLGVPGAAAGGMPGIRRSPSEVSQLGKMRPHLQFMCGPMLRYDTVVDNIWYGACMIVTADEGSQYDPFPRLTLFHASPHGPQSQTVEGQSIYIYRGNAGSFNFWRFLIAVPLNPEETKVGYRINGGTEVEFWIPAIGQHLRWIGQSCNGFSLGVKPEDFGGPHRLWEDVLKDHEKAPFHCVVGGGDQIYCDVLTREPELQPWVNAHRASEKQSMPLTPEISYAVDRFFFNHYCKWFRSGAFGKAISTIPQVNILDDHDLIDGFGSYPDTLMMSPIFNAIGSRGFFWYLLFQQFVVDAVDGTRSDRLSVAKQEANGIPASGAHTFKSTIIGGEGVYIPYPNHSLLTYLGPKVYMIGLDCRAERKLDQMCSETTWKRVFDAARALPREVEQLVWLIGVPLLYPRMVFVEKILESNLNPITHLSRTGSLGLAGFVNKFNKDAELLDDLNDHWCASAHKKERNWFIEECQKLAVECRLRISFLSGDVHAAAVGRCYAKTPTPPEKDHKLMYNIITSAIVNTPPPPAAAKMVNLLAPKTHKSLYYIDTAEDMVDLFSVDTDGAKNANKYVQPRRNWTAITFLEDTGELEFNIRVEISKGSGTTKSYPIRAPPPAWA